MPIAHKYNVAAIMSAPQSTLRTPTFESRLAQVKMIGKSTNQNAAHSLNVDTGKYIAEMPTGTVDISIGKSANKTRIKPAV